MAERAEALLGEAQSLLAARSVTGALAAFQCAQHAGGDPDACEAGQWECLMLLNRHDEAWQVSDAIEARLGPARASAPGRFWDGAPLAGRHVMLRCLHGFGDALQFIRYAPRLREQAASVCVECHAAIAPLLRACDGVGQVISWGTPMSNDGETAGNPYWNAQIEIMELPRMYRAPSATIPITFPYLHVEKLAASALPDPQTTALLRTMQERRERGRRQVGFSWRSSEWNPLRSVPFAQMAAFTDGVENTDFYSLQLDGGQALHGPAAQHIENIEAAFAELAVHMAALDCVITVDGVLAHLAGALGKPGLLLLPHAADWRWGCGERTPWYPRARLFRQQQPEDWAAPLAKLRAALEHEEYL